jgi:hypothetical protein
MSSATQLDKIHNKAQIGYRTACGLTCRTGARRLGRLASRDPAFRIQSARESRPG